MTNQPNTPEQPKEQQCPTCQGEGKVAIGEHHVTRDMARDAGDMRLEGSLYEVEYAKCKECDGSGIVSPEQPKCCTCKEFAPDPETGIGCAVCGGLPPHVFAPEQPKREAWEISEEAERDAFLAFEATIGLSTRERLYVALRAALSTQAADLDRVKGELAELREVVEPLVEKMRWAVENLAALNDAVRERGGRIDPTEIIGNQRSVEAARAALTRYQSVKESQP